MLSRISSFSGPLSKLFTSIKGFTSNGLILRYELKDDNSYSGTNTVTDLVSSSNATLFNGPTFSANGYLNFDGVNDYLFTNTSLNSKLSPVNTSTVISFFVWIYPTDNGVIVNEQGSSTLDFSWFDSQLEIVSGSLKFRVWPGSALTSTIPISFNKWYYLGLTYDGTTMKGWVNGQFAGSYNIARQTPYNNGSGKGLYYALASSASTNLGDGTNSKLKLGAFHVYNTALTQQQVLNNYNAQKSNYIYTENMSIWIDANDPQSYAGSGTTVTDMSGNNYTHSLAGATFTTLNGIKCFDCTTGTNRIVVDGTGPTLPTTGYTYIIWARLEAGNPSSFRTLIYTNSPKYTPITIPNGTNTLGYWDSAFRSSGYGLTSSVGVWVQYAVVGDNSSQTFYINDTQVGDTISFGSGGRTHWGLGNNDTSGQPWGYVANMMLYNTKLTQAQIKQNYDALKHVYNPEIVTDGMLLRLDANETLSYSGSGATWSDISGNGNHMSLKFSPTYVSSTISYFDFNGTTQYAQGTGLTVPSTAYTKSVWFWIDAYADNNIVSGYNEVGGHFLFMGSNAFTKIFVGHHQAVNFLAYQSTASISLNTWYNVTVTFNTTNGFKIYINGQLDSSHNMTLAHLGSGTTNLGAYSNGGGNYLNGRISKVYTYNRVLTASEVLQNFNADRAIFNL